MKRALITGITGQDGSYLAEFLLSKGYEVHGLKRRSSSFNTGRVDHIYMDEHEHKANLHMHFGDLSDSSQLVGLIHSVRPDEVYNLAAQSHVKVSFEMPEYTGDVTGLGAIRLLEAIRLSGVKARYYQASTSEMFGSAPPPQSETTPFHPRSPYGVAKLYAHWIAINYRESYGMFACNGILFNHESPRRGETFVTRKITRAVAAIMAGRQKAVYLGNLDAKRDWGYAPEYVVCQWMMLQQERPEDYVIGTGDSRTVREFIETSFAYAGVEIEWRGTGDGETGLVRSVSGKGPSARSTVAVGDVIVHIDPRYYRPAEVDYLLADPSRARKAIGWEPRVTFSELVKIMTDADLEMAGVEAPGESAAILRERGITWTNNRQTHGV
jgi:GDPmannose 4,6-dehydratase